MSRIAKIPVVIPGDVEIHLNGQVIFVKGRNGELTRTIHEAVNIQYTDSQLFFTPRKNYKNGWTLAGTMRALLNNMVIGVTIGFIKKLQLVGIGYRAVVNGNIVSLSIGFSHIIDYHLPLGISAECHSQTEILLKSPDKQIVGQVAADLRAYRPPEPYKGKGIRYADEIVHIKEAKKK